MRGSSALVALIIGAGLAVNTACSEGQREPALATQRDPDIMRVRSQVESLAEIADDREFKDAFLGFMRRYGVEARGPFTISKDETELVDGVRLVWHLDPPVIRVAGAEAEPLVPNSTVLVRPDGSIMRADFPVSHVVLTARGSLLVLDCEAGTLEIVASLE